MADTERLYSTLISMLSDGAAAHSTNRQLIRDLLKSVHLYPTLAGESGVVSERFTYNDVRRFGADPTGAVDAAAAFALTQTAVAGGEIVFPAGTFTFSTAITVSTSGTKIRGAGRNATILKFTGATDGIVLADGVSLARVGIEDLQIQTTNASALNALKPDFHTNGGTEHSLRNISVTVSGSGRWACGLWANNFQTSGVYNLRVVQSATIGLHFENSCNATNLYNIEVTGSSGVGTITRACEIQNTSDIYFHGGSFQGYFTQGLLRLVRTAGTSGGSFSGGFHFENTNAAPSDGADVTSSGVITSFSLAQVYGGTISLGSDSASIRNCNLGSSEFTSVTLGSGSQGCSVIACRAGSITDSGSLNTVLACSSAAGTPYANKIPGQLIKLSTATIPTLISATASSLLSANDARISALDSTGAVKEILIPVSSGDQTFLQFLTALNVRNTAGTQFAQMTATLWRLIADMKQTIESSNGAVWTYGQASELLTLSTVAGFTDTVGNLLPANSIIDGVVARVTTTITTATDWKLGDATTAGRFSAANATMTAGTTQVGTVHADQTGAGGPRQVAAAKVRVTTTGTPGAGAVRITVFYRQFAGPSS